jgi:hypothetical protein
MSRRGDDRIIWDYQQVIANDPDAMAAIEEAERIFEKTRQEGATAFKVDSRSTVERINRFDRTAEQIIIIPRVIGG